MSNQKEQSTTEQILDLLLDALIERQKARRATEPPPSPKEREAVPPPRPEPPAVGRQRPTEQRTAARPTPARPASPPVESQQPTEQRSAARPTPARPAPPPPRRREPQPGDKDWEPPPRQPSIQMGKMLGRLAILIIVLIILVNIPVTRYGVSLARILPDSAALIIRDGLVLKGSGPEIYILEDDRLRWISSMDAFEHLGLTWQDVHVVEDAVLDKFEKGRPVHVLLKCQGSPHIYRLENDQKRWIKDIDTFLAEGHVWEDVRFVTCEYLRGIPDGPPIPEDAGPPP
jgi:hypothetical protein